VKAMPGYAIEAKTSEPSLNVDVRLTGSGKVCCKCMMPAAILVTYKPKGTWAVKAQDTGFGWDIVFHGRQVCPTLSPESYCSDISSGDEKTHKHSWKVGGSSTKDT